MPARIGTFAQWKSLVGRECFRSRRGMASNGNMNPESSIEGKKKKNVTDYLADLQVSAGGKPVEWKLGGENVGPTQTHMWWDFAE